MVDVAGLEVTLSFRGPARGPLPNPGACGGLLVAESGHPQADLGQRVAIGYSTGYFATMGRKQLAEEPDTVFPQINMWKSLPLGPRSGPYLESWVFPGS